MAFRAKKNDDDELITRDPVSGAPVPRVNPATGNPVWLDERVLAAPPYEAAFAADAQLQVLRAAVAAAEKELVELRRPLEAVADHQTDLDALTAEIASRPGRVHAIEAVLPARRRAVLEREAVILRELMAMESPKQAELGAAVQDALYAEQVAHMKVERASWKATVVGNNLADLAIELNKRRQGMDEIDNRHGWS